MATFRITIDEYEPGKVTGTPWNRKYLWNGQAASKEEAIKAATDSMNDRKQ